MSLNARPIGPREVVSIFDKKMSDFQHKAKWLRLRHLEPDVYFEAAEEDPDVQLALMTGFIESLQNDLRDPVLVHDQELFTCPVLVCKVLADEPPELHRPFAEGVFMRKLFRFFVPATYEGGEPYEVTLQVREIMEKHFALQLVACETVLGKTA